MDLISILVLAYIGVYFIVGFVVAVWVGETRFPQPALILLWPLAFVALVVVAETLDTIELPDDPDININDDRVTVDREATQDGDG